jgi:hypothetical protein
LLRHQKDGFHVGVQLPVGQHHGDFGLNIGQRSHAADHHARPAVADKLDRQSGKRTDLHVVKLAGGPLYQVNALF